MEDDEQEIWLWKLMMKRIKFVFFLLVAQMAYKYWWSYQLPNQQIGFYINYQI